MTIFNSYVSHYQRILNTSGDVLKLSGLIKEKANLIDGGADGGLGCKGSNWL